MPLNLDGVDDVLAIADHAAFDWPASTNITIACLMRIDPADLTADNTLLFSTVNSDSGASRWSVRFRHPGTGADDRIELRYRTAAEAVSRFILGTAVARGVDWQVVAWEIEPDGASTAVRLRVNGYVIETFTVGDPAGLTLPAGVGLTVGAQRVDDTPTYSSFLNAEVMHLGVWRRLLTGSEHEALYNLTAPHDLADTTALQLSVPLVSDASVAFPTNGAPATTLTGAPVFSAAPTGPRETQSTEGAVFTPQDLAPRPAPIVRFDFTPDGALSQLVSGDFSATPEPSIATAFDGGRAMRATGRYKANAGFPSIILGVPEFSPVIDLTGRAAALRFFIPPPTAAKLSFIRLRVASGADINTDWAQYTVWGKNQQFGASGWREVHALFDLPASQTSGAPNLAAVRWMRLEIVGISADTDPLTPFDSGSPGHEPAEFDRVFRDTDTLTLASLKLYNAVDAHGGRGAILVRMDDNEAFTTDAGGTQYTNPKQIADIAAANGVRMHLGVHFNTTLMGAPPAHWWRTTNLLDAQLDGHLVLNHMAEGFGGSNDWQFNDAANGARDAQDIIENAALTHARAAHLGLGGWTEHVVVPGGFVGQFDHDALAGGFIKSLWYTQSTGAGQEARYGPVAWPQFSLGAKFFDAFGLGTTQAEVDTWIDEIVSSKSLGSMFFHADNVRADAGGGGGGLFNWPDTVAKIKAEVDAGNLSVTTIADLGLAPLSGRTLSRVRKRWRTR